MFTYSVIIPHFNIPDLLLRCLGSIPVRDDIQVIVVDDNSPSRERCREGLSALSRPYLTYIEADRNGGAGYARNIGIGKAEGKWLLFADADDFYAEDAFDVFDRYKDSDAGIIYFRVSSVMCDNPSIPSGREAYMEKLFRSKSTDPLRCMHYIPSGKMIRRSLVEDNGISFEDIPFSNDVVFSVKAGCAAAKVERCDHRVYYLTERPGSLTNHRGTSDSETECRLGALLRAYRIARDHGYTPNCSNLAHLLAILHAGHREAFRRSCAQARELNLPLGKFLAKGMVLRLWDRVAVSLRKIKLNK